MAPRRAATSDKVRRLQRSEAAERKERHIGDAVAGQIVDQGVVGAMRQIVMVLHADDLADPAPFRDLRRRDIAQPDVAHQALAAAARPATVSGASIDPSAGPCGVEHDCAG